MKFYLHFEGPPDHTMVFKWHRSEKGNLKLLLDKFVAAFNAKYAPLAELSLDDTTLVDKMKTTLSLEKDIISVVKDGMDLFVISKQFSKTEERPGNVLDSSKQSTVSPVSLNQMLRNKEKMATSLHVTNPASAKSSSIKENGSSSLEGKASSFCFKNLLKEGTMRHAARICAQALTVEENNSSALSCLAEIYLKAGRPKIALEYIQLALQVNPSDPVLSFMLGNCLAEVGKLDEAINAYMKYMGHLELTGASKSDIHDVQAAIAKVCAQEGNIRMAVELFSNVLKEDATHIDSLKGFALLTAGNSQEDLHEAITLILTALVHSNGNRELRRQVGKLISQPGGMEVFKDQLSEAWESADSMMFMADILRESGAIQQALELVTRARQLSPHNPSICLYFVHTYEILNEHNKAFLEARTFLERNRSLTIGCISCLQFVPFLEQVTEDIYLNNAPVNGLPKFENQQDVGKVLESEFHQLGLLFTLVKIFFVKGALNLVKALLPILDKVHKDRELHLTLLRNEAAFYSCISHVMQVPFSPMPCNPKFIYFASDSHCISPAWRIIDYCDKPHVIHPLLATGVKIWHVRKEGCFYPKFTLLNALKEVPNGSTVIFNIGEIDCREGLLRAVNSCKYDTKEEAIKATMDIYISFLKEQQEQRGFVTFVHPILPVLNETRSVVLEFNENLKAGVESCRGPHWLEFMNALLVNGGSEFRSEFKLDGTHVHPAYVSLLAKALKESLQKVE
ncbi:uncharacterized protein LOC144652530 [Oculina patagonica]